MRISDWSSDVCSSDLARELGREHEILAPSLQQLAQDRLGLAELIAIGRVDEIAASLGASVANYSGGLRIGALPPAGAEIAGSERTRGSGESDLSEARSFHVNSHIG